jgi:AmiR/NasT family two-component response regulator
MAGRAGIANICAWGWRKFVTAEDQVVHLHTALQSNRRIGMAIGILMGMGKIGESEALQLPREARSRRNVKLRLVAEDVIRTGTLG